MFYIKKIQAIQYNNNLEEVKNFVSPKYTIHNKTCPKGTMGLFSVNGEWIGYVSATDWLVKTSRKIKIYTDDSFKEHFIGVLIAPSSDYIPTKLNENIYG